MKRIVLPIIVVVVLIVGYSVGQLTAPKASAPALVTSPTVRQIDPNMRTGGDGALSTASPPSASAASSPEYWYGADPKEVGDGLEASIKKYKEDHQAPPSGAKLQPLNVQ